MITSIQDFVQYVKLMLGKPVQNVELDDSQIIQVIEDSVQIFQRYTYGEAVFRDVLSIQLSAGVSAYQLTSAIDSIMDIGFADNHDINTLFTVEHNLLYNSFMNGSVVGGLGVGGNSTSNMGGAYSMSNYTSNMMYLKTIADNFERTYYAQFSPNSYMMRVWPTPVMSNIAMLTIWKKEEAINLFNNILLKKLVLAKSSILWGTILGKYQISLPGSGNINYQIFIDRGTKEQDEAIESMKLETYPPLFFVG